MNKKIIIRLGSCFVFATVVVISLYAATRKIVRQHNSFLREYAKYAAVQSSEMDIEFNSWYIAGITPDHIYLGNVTSPLRLLTTNRTLTDSQHVKLRISDETATTYISASVKIDPPYFYIAEGRKPLVFRGLIGDWVAYPFPFDSTAYFTRFVPISKNSFAIRTNDARTMDNVLGKVQLDTPHLQLQHNLLQKQVDGVFCTDGMLHYNREMNKLIYTHYYRNEFIVYDTTLTLSYRGHSIDTFSHARIKVGYEKASDTKTLTDKEYVNIRSCTSGKYLFMWSNLLAKNDDRSLLDHSSVIDVYDLTDNTYRFSFFIPHFEKITMREFMIDNKKMIVLYDHYMVSYDLQPKYFDDQNSQTLTHR